MKLVVIIVMAIEILVFGMLIVFIGIPLGRAILRWAGLGYGG